ncbi:MAG TPA: CDP-alcohol phosphatidyltransferase family protein [Candidatus Nanopelagicaceae bacterium]
MNREDYFDTWSSLHGGARVTGIVKVWLRAAFVLSQPFVKIRISPNWISAIGVVASVFTYTEARKDYCLALLALALLCDGIDGTIAILSNTATKRGAMVDAICDRISEAFWAFAFYRLGAPAWLVGAAWVIAFTQEYSRARIAGLGDFRIDVVTIAERPVRASFLAVAILAYDLNVHAVTTLAAFWFAFQIVSLVMVMRSGYTRLSGTDDLGD